MKKKALHTGIAIAIILVLLACSSLPRVPAVSFFATNTPTASATLTPSATATLTASQTPTHTPSLTPTRRPTRTATLKPTMAFGDSQSYHLAGFKLRPPVGYAVDTFGNVVSLRSIDYNLLVTLTGGPIEGEQSSMTEDEFVDLFLNGIAQVGNGKMSKGKAFPTEIDGAKASGYPVSGTVNQVKYKGEALIFKANNNYYFFALGLAVTGDDSRRWERKGKEVYDAILSKIEFIGLVNTMEECQVSDDPNYGYSADHPIQVGGDWFEGPMNERMYLDNLRGPDGQAISYERTGSIEKDAVILDIYTIQYTGQAKPIVLYLDEYHYTELKAPRGLTCIQPFEVEAPADGNNG